MFAILVAREPTNKVGSGTSEAVAASTGERPLWVREPPSEPGTRREIFTLCAAKHDEGVYPFTP